MKHIHVKTVRTAFSKFNNHPTLWYKLDLKRACGERFLQRLKAKRVKLGKSLDSSLNTKKSGVE